MLVSAKAFQSRFFFIEYQGIDDRVIGRGVFQRLKIRHSRGLGLAIIPVMVRTSASKTLYKPLWLYIFFAAVCLLGATPALAQQTCAGVFLKETPEASATHSFYSKEAAPKIKNIEYQNPPFLIISRYAGQKDFQAATHLQYVQDSTTFKLDASMQFRDATESHLGKQQDFSLNKMVESGYLQPEDAAYFRNLGGSFLPEQVSFIEFVRQMTPKEYDATYEGTARHRDTLLIRSQDSGSSDLISVKTAAMWNIAGQFVDPVKGRVIMKLPWEKEEARKGQALDRNKYKMVFEWGRAAQDIPGDIKNIYAANTLLTYMQIKAMGGNIADAYVMVHSFDKINTRLYSRMHPNTRYPPDCNNPQDTLFLVPFMEALEKYPPSSVSHNLARMIELSEGHLSELVALELLYNSRAMEWQELDYRGPGENNNKAPVIYADFSNAMTTSLWNYILTAGLNKKASAAVFEFLTTQGRNFHAINFNNKYENAADSKISGYYYTQRNAIEVSNLDPEVAVKNSNYAKWALFKAFDTSLRQVTEAAQMTKRCASAAECHSMALKYLRDSKVAFGITTGAAEVRKQVELLLPNESVLIPATTTNGIVDSRLFAENPYMFRDAKAYFFSVEQVLELWKKTPHAELDQMVNSFSYDFWSSQYHLSRGNIM